MIRRKVRVTGRVQGVFFRDACHKEAVKLGLGGEVRNESDGSVAAVFEGDQKAVEAMCDWCRTGSDQADVEHIEITEEEPQGHTSFDVK
jgi:acylphosphatase